MSVSITILIALIPTAISLVVGVLGYVGKISVNNEILQAKIHILEMLNGYVKSDAVAELKDMIADLSKQVGNLQRQIDRRKGEIE
jgi:signal transduction histidine kinase